VKSKKGKVIAKEKRKLGGDLGEAIVKSGEGKRAPI